MALFRNNDNAQIGGQPSCLYRRGQPGDTIAHNDNICAVLAVSAYRLCSYPRVMLHAHSQPGAVHTVAVSLRSMLLPKHVILPEHVILNEVKNPRPVAVSLHSMLLPKHVI